MIITCDWFMCIDIYLVTNPFHVCEHACKHCILCDRMPMLDYIMQCSLTVNPYVEDLASYSDQVCIMKSGSYIYATTCIIPSSYLKPDLRYI